MTPSHEAIWGLICGYSAHRRRRVGLLMLKGYFDASGKGAKDVFVLGGYISTPERWLKFTDDWDAALSGDGKFFQPMKAFKLRNMDMTSTRQLARCAIFHKIANEHAMVCFRVFVDAEAAVRVYKNSWWSGFLDKNLEPNDIVYWFGFRALNEAFRVMKKDHPEIDLDEEIDFIFDQENERDKASLVAAWKYLYKTSSPEKRKLFGNMPNFGNDELIKPLQAADLAAGLARKNALAGKGIKNIEPPWGNDGRKKILTITMEYFEEDIRRNLNRTINSQLVNFFKERWKFTL